MASALDELKKIPQITFKGIFESFAKGNAPQETLRISDELMQKFYDASLEYLEERRYKEAADCFLFLVALNPLESNLWIKAGNCAQHLLHFEEALEAYSMATFCNADDPFPHLYAAQVYSELKETSRVQECLKICLRLIEENPDFLPLKETALKMQKAIKSDHKHKEHH